MRLARTREIGIDDKLSVSAKIAANFPPHTEPPRHHKNHRTDPTMSDEESYEYEYE